MVPAQFPLSPVNTTIVATYNSTFKANDYQAYGYPLLQAGMKYTFSLSVAFGGGWLNSGQGNYGLFYDNSLIASYNNALLPGYIVPGWGAVTQATLSTIKFTFQVPPAYTVYTEDNSVTPVITSYVPSGTIFTKNQPLQLATDIYVWTMQNSAVNVHSSRGSIDTFKPANGTANNNGLFFTSMYTTQPSPPPSAVIGC